MENKENRVFTQEWPRHAVGDTCPKCGSKNIVDMSIGNDLDDTICDPTVQCVCGYIWIEE